MSKKIPKRIPAKQLVLQGRGVARTDLQDLPTAGVNEMLTTRTCEQHVVDECNRDQSSTGRGGQRKPMLVGPGDCENRASLEGTSCTETKSQLVC